MLLYFEFSNKEVLLVNKTIITGHSLRSFDNGGRDIGLTSISINKFNAKKSHVGNMPEFLFREHQVCTSAR